MRGALIAVALRLQGCRCDANVQSLAQGLGIQPAGFYTLGRAGMQLFLNALPHPCRCSL